MIGQIVSRYRIEERLGAGAMGVVFRAVDLKLERHVALKFLPPEYARDEAAKRRFIQEAKAGSRLDHPHIGHVYEIGESEEGRVFIVMPFYEGETLKQKISRGPLAIEDAVGLALQISRGLEAAHEAGIIHRDLKPANVMVTHKGRAKIVDFGLAKVAGVELTASGATLGTAAYMSPEQARGGAVDGRSDLWALGVLLYEMLTGERPFGGDFAEAVLYAILHTEAPPVHQLTPDVPEVLDRLIADLLQKDPSKRPETATAVARRLESVRRIASGPGVFDEVQGGGGFLRQLVAPQRRIFLLAVLVLVGGLLTYGLLQLRSAPSAADNALVAGEAENWLPRLGHQSIAVLPFTYLAADDSSDYLSQGMTDELLIRLSQIEDLSVISRTSVMQYLHSDKTIPEIGHELGVAYVLEGNVQKVGSQIRIQAQLIDARTDRHVWADGFTRPYRNVLQLQVDLARQIAAQLHVTMLPATQKRLTSAAEVDSAAYERYLQARSLRLEETAESMTAAMKLAQESVALDSTFAPAWALLAFAWLSRTESVEDTRSLSRRAAKRAIELDSMNAEANIAMGVVQYQVNQSFPAAAPFLKRAVQLNPSLSETHREYGLYLQRMGQFDLAGQHLRRAAELDPASDLAMRDLALNHLFAGRYNVAREQLIQVMTTRPAAGRYLAMAYARLDSMEAALRAARTVSIRAEAESLLLTGWIHIQAGRIDSARYALQRLRQDFPNTAPQLFLELQIAEAVGEVDRMRSLLLGLVNANAFHPEMKVLPLTEPFRDEPLYQEWLRSVGLDDESVRRTMEKLRNLESEA